MYKKLLTTSNIAASTCRGACEMYIVLHDRTDRKNYRSTDVNSRLMYNTVFGTACTWKRSQMRVSPNYLATGLTENS